MRAPCALSGGARVEGGEGRWWTGPREEHQGGHGPCSDMALGIMGNSGKEGHKAVRT